MVHAACASTASAPAPLPTRHFLIASRQILKIKLTRSQQTRKHFLIASFSVISAPAPHLTHHSSRITHPRLTPFLISTNKPPRITIPLRAPLKTKEKQFSIPYKFAVASIGLPAACRPTLPATRGTNHDSQVTNHDSPITTHCTNATCLAVPVMLSCPAASGPIWFAQLGTGA
jgi:hypothetical protein